MACRQDPDALRHASERLRSHHDVVRAAVAHWGSSSLAYASQELQETFSDFADRVDDVIFGLQ